MMRDKLDPMDIQSNEDAETEVSDYARAAFERMDVPEPVTFMVRYMPTPRYPSGSTDLLKCYPDGRIVVV